MSHFFTEQLTLRIWGQNLTMSRMAWDDVLDDIRPESENHQRILELIAGGSLRIDNSGYGDVVGYHESHRLGIRRALINAVKFDSDTHTVHVLRIREIPKDHPDYRAVNSVHPRCYIAVAEVMYNRDGNRAIYGLSNTGAWVCFAN